MLLENGGIAKKSGFENVFAPYSKKNVTYVVESTLAETRELLVANVLWKNPFLSVNNARGCTE